MYLSLKNMKHKKEELKLLDKLLETYLFREEIKKTCEEAYLRYRMKHKLDENSK